MQVFIPYLHYLGIMILMGALIAMHLMLKPDTLKQQLKLITAVDLFFWLAALLVLASGLLRWFVYDPKGTAFFSTNPLFHIKLTLFALMIILAIFPCLKLSKWRRQKRQENDLVVKEKDVKKQLMFIRLELLLLAIIPLLAVMVALGKRF